MWHTCRHNWWVQFIMYMYTYCKHTHVQLINFIKKVYCVLIPINCFWYFPCKKNPKKSLNFIPVNLIHEKIVNNKLLYMQITVSLTSFCSFPILPCSESISFDCWFILLCSSLFSSSTSSSLNCDSCKLARKPDSSEVWLVSSCYN